MDKNKRWFVIQQQELRIPQVATPVITITAGEVTIECATEGAEIYYTLDGATPTTESTAYNSESKPSLTDPLQIKAMGTKEGWINSDVSEKTLLEVASAMGYSEVGTAAELNSARDGLSGKYIQTANIDITYDTTNAEGLYYNSGSGWNPIGATDNEFTGTYNGNGYSIGTLRISRAGEDNIGLFGRTNGARIVNVTLVLNTLGGKRSVGGLIGFALDSVIINCSTSGSMTGLSGDTGHGGLIGRATGTSSRITDCHARASITSGASGGYVGGLIGSHTNGSKILRCGAEPGSISASGGYVGGLVGNHCTNVEMEQCWVVTVGGITSDSSPAGGLVGWNDVSSIITDCYARAEISALDSFGGLCGEFSANSDIINCYSTGELVDVYGSLYIGGLIGENLDAKEPVSSYWDTQTSQMATSNGGVGKTTAEMKQQATFADWDFSDVWAIDPLINDGYPYLKNNPPE